MTFNKNIQTLYIHQATGIAPIICRSYTHTYTDNKHTKLWAYGISREGVKICSFIDPNRVNRKFGYQITTSYT